MNLANRLTLSSMLYEEVYIVGVDSTITPAGEVVVCGSYEQLLDHLKTKNTSICYDLRVIHGVLTSAKSIPKKLYSRQAFIIVVNQENNSHGTILDSDSDDSFEELAYEVRSLLKGNKVTSFFFGMDQIFILYGYELNIVMSVDEDDIDDITINTCQEIADVAKILDKIGEN